MTQPLVSIITPSYNSKRFILETIASVKNQTYQNFEMIIVDDCSTDDSLQLIQQEIADDSRFNVYKLEKNSGAALARNFGIQKANGKYVAFLDSDDLWHSEKLEKQIAFMEENNYNFTFTNYEMIDEQGEDIHRKVICPITINYEQLLRNTTIGCLTVILNIEKLGKIQMPDLQPEDTALWLKVLKNGETAYCYQEVLAKYRIVGNSASSNKLNVAKKMWVVYRKSENIPVWKSSWYFMMYAINAVKKHYL